MPFGEDLGAGQFGRTTAQGCEPSGTPSNPREKFAACEGDDETGLNFDQARYYQSRLGRFTTPDEFTGGPTELFAEVAAHNPTFYAELAEPPSLNKRQYCLNNWLKFVDPAGHRTEGLVRADAGSRLGQAAGAKPSVKRSDKDAEHFPRDSAAGNVPVSSAG
jgi:RHS repeat-associated protein